MRRWLLLLLSMGLLLSRGSAAPAEEAPDFDKVIAPILASRCIDCHSGPEAKGKLDLSRSTTAFAGGESGAGVVAGKPDESTLWQRVDAGEMPPKKPLPEAERKLLQAWIAGGAKWGTDPLDPFRFSTSTRAGYNWWSLQPLVQPKLPTTVADAWAGSPIDAFVLERLRTAGLKPSAQADRRTLIRRLYFDLLGLPPSPEAIVAFENDPAPDAYDRLVDRLLASPQHGERWARHWLDVAHFGESDGFEFDRMRPQAWRYRDWVIESLNRDLPYDQFAKLQIAGDIGGKDSQTLAATGFLVAGAHDSLIPQGEAMRAIMRHDELEDIVGIVSQSFLGMTVNCARCHDHKFDPIPQTDYYRLEAALAGVRRGDRDVNKTAAPGWLTARRDSLKSAVEKIEQRGRATILARREAKRKKGISPPQPIARWNFDADGRDELGGLDLQLAGTARIEAGRLQLDGEKAFATSLPLKSDLTAKTLEVWVQLANLSQRGGGAITLETLSGNEFDSIVFAEQSPAQWTVGSNFFARTQSLNGAAETVADERPVHVAIVYQADGRIVAYRDGQPHGEPYESKTAITFKAGESHVVLGLRHAPAAAGKMLNGSIDRAQLYDRALSAEEIAASAGVESNYVTADELIAELSTEERNQREHLQMLLTSAVDQIERWNQSKAFTITPQQPQPTHLLVRGNPQQKAEVIAAGGLIATGKTSSDFGLGADAPEDQRRLKLAEWIASDGNPLFSRTMVNRLWHYHFGRGLVDTPNDLGYSGGLPSHPELLDWLAVELVNSGFSLKEIHRLIVTSAAYQQKSRPRDEAMAVDADNRLLWRMSPRRLDAESLRDTMLLVSGQLNSTLGGPSFHDFRAFNRAGTQFYEPQDHSGPEFQRRSIYRMWARGGKNLLLDTFDCPDPSTTSPKRSVTTTPLQALSLLNNAFTLRMADALAADLERSHAEDAKRQVELAFQLACGRQATETELQPSAAFVKQHGLAAFCRVLFNSNAFLYVD
jgi:hypothetical protein